MITEKRFRKHVLQAVGAYKKDLDMRWSYDNTPNNVCTTFGVSRNVLQKRFKEQYGMGIREYKLQQRMHLSRHLLIAGKDVKEIAVILHYSQPRVFTAAFKRYYGITPSDFTNTQTKESEP